MDRKIILSILAAAAFAFAGLWLLLSAIPDERAGLRLYPWDVGRNDAGRVQVFGLTLGESTLAETRARLGDDGKLSLFAEADGRFAVEAYFENLFLSNLKADWVIPLAVDQPRLEAMYDRGLRASKLASGARRVKLDPGDAEALAAAPIRAITYLPWKNLRPEDISGRFGPPAESLTEPNGVVHRLYPEHGLDIARDPDGGVVIQYLNRDDFERARAALGTQPTAEPEPPADGPDAGD
jgi:hypothetical protein